MPPDLASPYVPLQRRFRRSTEQLSTLGARQYLGSAGGATVATLIPELSAANVLRSALVVLSASGMGKTTTLQARAAELHAAGVPAFFMRAVDLMTAGVDGAVDSRRFSQWVSQPASAVFIIDGLDELALQGRD